MRNILKLFIRKPAIKIEFDHKVTTFKFIIDRSLFCNLSENDARRICGRLNSILLENIRKDIVNFNFGPDKDNKP